MKFIQNQKKNQKTKKKTKTNKQKQQNDCLLGFVVLELDVEAALDAHLHADILVLLGELPQGVHGELQLVRLVADTASESDPQHIAQPHVRACIALVRLLHLRELEWQRCVRTQLAGPRELANQRNKFVAGASVRIQFCIDKQFRIQFYIDNYNKQKNN